MEALSRPPHQAYRLAEWVEANKRLGRSRQWCAGACGCSEQAFSRYLKEPGSAGFRVPEKEAMARIYVATGGLVQPNSFYQLPDLSEFHVSPTLKSRQGEAA